MNQVISNVFSKSDFNGRQTLKLTRIIKSEEEVNELFKITVMYHKPNSQAFECDCCFEAHVKVWTPTGWAHLVDYSDISESAPDFQLHNSSDANAEIINKIAEELEAAISKIAQSIVL